MPKFEFSLEAVLTQRRFLEEERQRALGVILARMAELERELRHLDQTVQEAGVDLRTNRLTGVVDLAFLAGHRRFVLATERKAREVIQKMAFVQKQIDQARTLLVEAARATKVVEKLRERKFDTWRMALLKKEQDETDEVGGNLTILEWQDEAREAEMAADAAAERGESEISL